MTSRANTDGDLAYRHAGRWHLVRNIAAPGAPEDWCYWFVSMPDTGQDAHEVLAAWEEGGG